MATSKKKKELMKANREFNLLLTIIEKHAGSQILQQIMTEFQQELKK